MQFDYKWQEFQQVMNSGKLFNIVEFIFAKCINMNEDNQPKDQGQREKIVGEFVSQLMAFVKFIIPCKLINQTLIKEIIDKVFLKWMCSEKQKREENFKKNLHENNPATLENQLSQSSNTILALPDQNSREINFQSANDNGFRSC